MIGYRDPRFRAMVFGLRVLVVAGIAARLALAMASVGSHDALLWRQFGELITTRGFAATYAGGDFNHPPLAAGWLFLATKLASALDLRFAFVFKWPMLLADAVVCWLLVRIGERRGSLITGLFLAALWAWNPGAILVSAFHCNTDPIYVALSLLAVHLAEDRRHNFLAGVALAAAINVKLIPALLVIPMIGMYRDAAGAMRFVGGLSIGAIPYAVAMLAAPEFAHKVVSYNPTPAFWGVGWFLRKLVQTPEYSGWAQPILDAYHALGRWMLLLAIVWATLAMRRRARGRSRADRYAACAVAAALLLVVGPGFAMQYTVFPAALLLVVNWRFGALWGVLTGAQLLSAYLQTIHTWRPIDATLPGREDPSPSVYFGLLAWASLVVFVWSALNSRSRDKVAQE